MEAMSSGLPCVSTRLAGIPDIIQDGHSGLLVSPGSSSELADALQSFIDDPVLAGQIAVAGRESILSKFKLDECLDPLVILFRQFLKSTDSTCPPKLETSV